MTTSGSIDFTMTAQGLATWALRKIGVVSALDTPAAEDMRDAIADLNLMLKGFQLTAPNIWRQSLGSVALVAATEDYVITPRPFRITECRYRDANGRDLPMNLMTRQEYVDLPMKDSSGIPTNYYADYQRTSTTIYVWPVPASVTTETLQFTYQRVFDDIDAQSNDIDIPQEWLETVGYNLAARLTDRFPSTNQRQIKQIAAQMLSDAGDADREDVIRFAPERRR